MKLFVTAGEPSGDSLGGALIRALREFDRDLAVQGVGGPRMAAQGLVSLFPMDELSVMGIAEILPKYVHLKRRIRQTAEAALAADPDLIVTIDSPDFSFRVIDLVRRRSSVRTVHYVAPTVWAWRPGRARRLADRVDQVLALFPFEPPYFEAEGLRCDFVGHPIAVEPPASEHARAALRDEIGPAAPLIVALPGSRAGEVARLGPTFGRVLQQVSQVHQAARVVVPTVSHRAEAVRAVVAEWPLPAHVVVDDAARHAAMAIADVALTKSGTVSLELAAARTPMVVAHDANPLTRFLLRRMLRIDTVTLVNLVSETRSVPEFLGERCRADLIAPALLDLIAAPDAQAAALDLTMERLGRGGDPPETRAARAILDGLNLG